MNVASTLAAKIKNSMSESGHVNGKGHDHSGNLNNKVSDNPHFLSLLTSLISSENNGNNPLVELISSQSKNGEESLNSIASILESLQIRLDGENTIDNKSTSNNNFIFNNMEIEGILDNIKKLSGEETNVKSENLSGYMNLLEVSSLNGQLQMNAMGNLNSYTNKVNVENLMSFISSNSDNKDLMNTIKFLQKFTNSDGTLDMDKLLNTLKQNQGNKTNAQNNDSFSNMLFQGNNGLTDTAKASENIKNVTVFNKNEIVDVIVENFKTLRLPGRTEIRIKLNPAELGEISIRLVLEKGQISAVLSADKKDTFNLLQHNMHNLLNQLKENNIDLHHIAVNLENNDSGEHARRGYKEEKDESSKGDFDEIINEAALDEDLDKLI